MNIGDGEVKFYCDANEFTEWLLSLVQDTGIKYQTELCCVQTTTTMA